MNKILNLINLVDEYKVFFILVPIYMIFPRDKKPAYTTLKTDSILNSFILTDL